MTCPLRTAPLTQSLQCTCFITWPHASAGMLLAGLHPLTCDGAMPDLTVFRQTHTAHSSRFATLSALVWINSRPRHEKRTCRSGSALQGPDPPKERNEDERDGREDQPVDRFPARCVKEAAGEKGCAGNDAEDHEVVGALGLASFFRSVAVRHHGGGADEAEVPAEPQQDQRSPEMADGGSRERRNG